MLNKEICQKCHKHHAISTPDQWFWKWDNTDEELWEDEHVILCPYDPRNLRMPAPPLCHTPTDRKPPGSCSYYLEHTIITFTTR